MTKHRILAIALSLTFAACQNPENHDDPKGDAKSAINLNEGQKWQVNPEMKPHVENGKELLAEYISENQQGYKELADNLRSQNNALIKSCTMKGESHDELHKWLHPHIELVDKLSKTENAEEAGEVVSLIQESYETYEVYFE